MRLAALLVLALLASPALAAGTLTLDHDLLLSMVQTREPAARIGYTADRLEIRTRRSILVGWADVLLTARFERRGDRVQLIAKSLRAAGMAQTGPRFVEASAGLVRLVNVKTEATRVDVLRGGKVVFTQELE